MGKRVRRTTLIAIGLAAFLIGLVLARRVSIQPSIGLVFILAIGAWLLIKRNRVSLACILIMGLILGCCRGTAFMSKINNYVTLSDQSVEIEAVAKSDSVYGDRSQLDFDVSNIRVLKPVQENLVGTMRIKGFGENMVYSGDTVKVSGKLYLAKGSRQGGISFGQIKKTAIGNSWIDKLRRNFATGMQNSLPEPLSSFGLGLLIGQRTTLSQDFNDQLSKVGLTHIVAVSGYNLTIMVLLAHRLARKKSKFQSNFLTIGLIVIFDLLTGFSASIVRATIVSILSLIAWNYGRTFRPIVILLLAAAITAGYFPPYLWSDIGWYLSFLAFSGVLIVSPLIIKRFFKSKPKALTSMVVETFSALALTTPIIMFIFGRFSLIAIIANILIVPLVPIAMAFCFAAGLAGMLLPVLAGYFAWPAKLIMTYIVEVIRILASVPHASVSQKLTARQMIFVYSVLSVIFTVLFKRTNVGREARELQPDQSVVAQALTQ